MKEKQKIIQKKELLRQIAELKGYHLYQVEDILHGLGVVLAEELSENVAVKVHGVGTFKYKPSRKVENFSPLLGKKIDTMSKAGVKFEPCKELSNRLNKIV